MFKRVGALALILSAAAIFQPTAASAQERYEGRYQDRGYHDRDRHDRDHDRHEWREHERREWRDHDRRWDYRDRDYRRAYRGGEGFYFGVGPSYGYYESRPVPYYRTNPYCER